MKTLFFIPVFLLLTACVNPMSTAKNSVFIVDAESGAPQAGVEFVVLSLKRPYWIVGHLQRIGSVISDGQGVIMIPDHALVTLPKDSDWIEVISPSVDEPRLNYRIRIKRKTEPNKALQTTIMAVTDSAAQTPRQP